MRSGTGHCISGVQHNYDVVHVEMLLPASQADGVNTYARRVVFPFSIGNTITVVNNHWTGLVDWTSGLYWWTHRYYSDRDWKRIKFLRARVMTS